MTSTLLGGCSAWVTPVTTTTAMKMMSIAAMIAIQCSSVRTTTGSGTTPSGSGRCSGFVGCSANGTSRHKEEEIEKHPANEEQPDGNAGDDEGADRSLPERLSGFVRADRRGDVLW